MHRVLWLLFLSAAATAAAERINHEGRILGDLPAVTQPLLFNTPAADSVVAAMQIMPRDSPWNENISSRPVLSNYVDLRAVADHLVRRGLSESQLAGVLIGNYARIVKQAMNGATA